MTKKHKVEKTRERSLAKGLLAGLIGGVIATAAKSIAERIYPPQAHGEPVPPALPTGKLAGYELAVREKTAEVESTHWGFGALAGAAYGAVVEYYPAANSKDGAAFGMALSSLTHGTALPAFGLSVAPEDQTPRERSSEMASLVVFGVVTETVRRVVRKMLG
jgi:putative membrane protein